MMDQQQLLIFILKMLCLIDLDKAIQLGMSLGMNPKNAFS